HHPGRHQLIPSQHRETRREERHAVIAVGRSVDGIDDHRELATPGLARLLTHHAKASTVQDAKRDLVSGYIETILRVAKTRETAVSTQLNDLANLVGALTKWGQK